MRTDKVIRKRLRVILSSEFDRRVDAAQKRLPCNCTHNYRHPLDVRKNVDGERNDNYNRISDQDQTIGLCLLGCNNPDQWLGRICEDPIDAQTCPDFNPAMDKDLIIREYREQLMNAAWVSQNLPEAHALSWVLDEPLHVDLPWWKRCLFWLVRLKVEPLSEKPDLPELLATGLTGLSDDISPSSDNPGDRSD